MRWLFIMLIGVLTTSDVMSRSFGIGTGLSAKNLLLYLIILGLLFRNALSGRFKMRLPILHLSFALWLGYALLTWVACVVIIRYAGYNVHEATIALKDTMIDPALFFFAAFYAAENEDDVQKLLKALGIAFGVASLLTLTDVAGITSFGVRIGSSGAEADRVFGVFGHANDTAALIVCLLPMLVAMGLSEHRVRRALWLTTAAAAFAVLVLTVSRGAFVGLAIGYTGAVLLCKRHLPASRIGAAVLVGISVALLIIGVATIALPHVGETLVTRLLGSSGAVDLSEVSSGRTNIWKNTVEHMFAQPISLLTGFGWHAYDARFIYVTHNYYLEMWFNLGLIGLGSLLVILYQAVKTARAAVDVAAPRERTQMIAFVFGALGLAVCLFFTNLTRPWPYIWMYFGISLRGAIELLMAARAQRAARRDARAAKGNVVISAAPRRRPARPQIARTAR